MSISITMKSRRIIHLAILGTSMYSLCAFRTSAQTPHESIHWVSSWGAAQQVPEQNNLLPAADFSDATLRQIVHLSLGGPELCLHLTNAFGTSPLHLNSVHMASAVSASSAAIIAGTDHEVTFGGRPDVTIPAGAEYLSDPIKFKATPFSNLAISIHYDGPPAQQTGHPGSHATSYFVHGDEVAATDLPKAQPLEHWYQISEVDVAAPPAASAIVTFGDSITDGHGSTTNGNNRWPDLLAQRLLENAATKNIAVVNAGIGGGRVLLDGLGPNALARFDRDVLARPGVQAVILLEGVNDLGVLTRDSDKAPAEHQALVRQLIAAYEQMIMRAHDRGVRIFGATITPYVGSGYYHPGPQSEADRQVLNAWIRAAGHFDGVADFDKAIRDPAHPDHILPAFDSGDHLHPSPAGYHAMAGAVSLKLFEPSRKPR
jgi:lysophospholipase L1-like esterase